MIVLHYCGCNVWFPHLHPYLTSVPINALLLVDENVLATGDDGGTLKVWDMRKGTSFMDLKHHDDYISGIAIDQAKRMLLTSR